MPFHLIPKTMRAATWKIPGTPPARVNTPNPGDGALAKRYGAALKFPTQGSVRHAGDAVSFRVMSANTDRGSARVSHPGEYLNNKERLCDNRTGYRRQGDKLVSPKRPIVKGRFNKTVLERMFPYDVIKKTD